MNAKEIIEQANAQYKAFPQDDIRQCKRDFILSLSPIGISTDELKKALSAVFDVAELRNKNVTWKFLKRKIYEKYMIDIGEEKKPNFQEVYFCWLNLDTQELSTIKNINVFQDEDNCILVLDYRILGENVSWKDIAIL